LPLEGATQAPEIEVRMQVHVTFRHLEPSQAVKEYVQKKSEKFQKFLHEPIEVHVILEVQKLTHKAEVNVSAKNVKYHGLEESPNLYASIDLVTEKIGRQIRKHKEIVKEHKHTASTYEAAQVLNGSGD